MYLIVTMVNDYSELYTCLFVTFINCQCVYVLSQFYHFMAYNNCEVNY